MRAFVSTLLLAAIAIAPLPAFGQSDLPTAAPLEQTFNDLISEAKASVMSNPPRALELADIAESKANGATFDIATAKWLKSEAFKRMHQIDDARKEVDAAIEIVEKDLIGGQLKADLLKSLGTIAKHQGDYALALNSLRKSHDIFAEIDNPRSQAITLQQMGSIFSDARQYERAIDSFDRSGLIWSDDVSLDLARFNNIANANLELANFDSAIEGFTNALAIAEEIEAVVLQSRIVTSIAHAEAKQEKLNAAKSTLEQAKDLLGPDDQSGWSQFIAGVEADILYRSGDLSGAKNAINDMFADMDLSVTDMMFTDFHELAYQIHTAAGNTEDALMHLSAFKRLDDEALSIAASANTALLSAEFDFASQELAIATLRAETLEQEVEIKEAQARQRLVIFVSASAIGTILMFGLSVSYVSIRRSRNQVRDANAQLSTTNSALEKALKAKSEFLATTSHEIRTPLNGIIGMTEILLRGSKLEPGTLDRVEAIHGSSQTMKAIVDDILDVSKMESGVITITPEEFDLSKTLHDVERVWRDSASNKGLDLSLELDNCPARVIMDPQRLRQIAFNLSSNAVKFTEKGHITLTCSTQVDSDKDWLVFSVQDTGIGIPEDQHELIFEPFHQVDGGTTRNQGGTGLGLTICRNFARAMGGDVTVVSTPETGSTFTLRVPIEIVRQNQVEQDENLVLAVEPNLMKQHLLTALFADRDETLKCVNDITTAQSALGENNARIIILAASMLGEDVGAGMGALMALKQASGDAEIIVFSDIEWAQPPMLRISGATQVIQGSLEPVALLKALSSPESPKNEQRA